jgi:hypothetical protein
MPPRKRVGIKIKIRIQHAQGGRGDLRGDSGDSGRGGGGGVCMGVRIRRKFVGCWQLELT